MDGREIRGKEDKDYNPAKRTLYDQTVGAHHYPRTYNDKHVYIKIQVSISQQDKRS